MSLAALQRQDPYINKLLDVTGQVALYNFNSKENEWVNLTTHPKRSRSVCSPSMLACFVLSAFEIEKCLHYMKPPLYSGT